MTKPIKSIREFVRYENRKLHEIGDGNPYTTMEELLTIVASGISVRVIQDGTGEDITAFTLSRLIYDRSRMDRGAYSVGDLRKLIMSSPPDSSKAA